MAAFTALLSLSVLLYAGTTIATFGPAKHNPACWTCLIIDHSSQLEQQAKELRGLREEVASLKTVVESLKVLNRTRGGKEAPKTMFRAVLGRPVVANAPIIFNIQLQTGEVGYNVHTGIFTVPVSGVYLFTFQLFPTFPRDNLFDLMVNGAVWIRSKSYNSGVYPTSSASSSFLRLQKGDKVWMQANGGGVFHGGPHSFLSGALITADP